MEAVQQNTPEGVSVSVKIVSLWYRCPPSHNFLWQFFQNSVSKWNLSRNVMTIDPGLQCTLGHVVIIFTWVAVTNGARRDFVDP